VGDPYRIYGSELSPYSVKVRSYLRYKALPHRWIVRSAGTQADFQKYARLPLIPVVVMPDERALQDSTPILEELERRHPEPSIHPSNPVAAFVSALLEEFGDEWGNKWMFHYRWARELDQWSAAGRIACSMLPGADDAAVRATAAKIRERMTARIGFVGSNEQTAPQIEQSFRDLLGPLDAHLAERPYLFGGRPAFADFGLWPQLYEMWTDPTPGAWIEGRAPHVLDWIQRMLWPRAEGPFESWDALESGLLPLLDHQVGRLFLPWSHANARAVAEHLDTFEVDLGGHTWHHKPQKYHARSLGVLLERYASAPRKDRIDPVLARAGCLELLRP